MKSNSKILILIVTLMSILSISLSIINYVIAQDNAETQLKTQFLPLTVDNIYTDIQKDIVEPHLISSMMANDTFVKEWLLNNEEDDDKIQKYLNNIKNKYKVYNTFLVSKNTKKYYTEDGFHQTISNENKSDLWYFNFTSSSKINEVNLNINNDVANILMLYVNYKIFDEKLELIGVTGVALRVSHIQELLKKFRKNNNLNVTFYDEQGNVVLAERSFNTNKKIDKDINLKEFKDKIISKNANLFEYSKNGNMYFVQTRYISELNLYLSVEIPSSNSTSNSKNLFYFNLIISFIVIVIITLLILHSVDSNTKQIIKLAEFDTLTKLMNRRLFKERLNHFLLLNKRDEKKLSLVFADIDNFKNVNDNFGHNVGDEVLKHFSSILKDHMKETDLVARWGGEEFIILLIDCDKDQAVTIIKKLQNSIENYKSLHSLVNYNVTASFGITEVKKDDNSKLIISRADKAMYVSKDNGKDRLTVI